MVFLVLLLALFAPILSPQDPNYMSLSERFAGPSIKHPFGLDENGSDVFAKVAYGARISLGVGITVVVVSLVIGLIVGSFAGVLGGWIDGCICGFINIVYSFPSFLLALALIAMLGPSIKNVIIAMCLSSWTGYARLVRGEILHLRERDFIQTVKALGGSRLRQTVIHIWPNLTGPLMVHSTFAIAGTIIAESGLSFWVWGPSNESHLGRFA
ncbi:MAG: ABC transporter permease [Bdellovibrionales bacterium]|nr:ABC transporter permease [Bdellovibrionales bacterium]